MSRRSAGILMYRYRDGEPEVLLVHPGGPFWAHRDEGAWSVPKGLYEEGETPLEAARREFEEETGFPVAGEFVDLGELKLPSGKRLRVWAVEGDLDAERIRSNTFEMEWPRGSGRLIEVPEVDRGAWFDPEEARRRIAPGQLPFLERLLEILRRRGRDDGNG
ncbi:MAG: NUDIX domain-containing protein [Gammaproteobacteria bacterium]|nr:MAG: NUDIX domain-containing protein [Gammaproteobacteria bacterium]